MTDHGDQINDLHADLVDLLNRTPACDACKLSALSGTMGMALLSLSDNPGAAIRMLGAVTKEITEIIGDHFIERDRAKGEAGPDVPARLN